MSDSVGGKGFLSRGVLLAGGRNQTTPEPNCDLVRGGFLGDRPQIFSGHRAVVENTGRANKRPLGYAIREEHEQCGGAGNKHGPRRATEKVSIREFQTVCFRKQHSEHT